MCLGFQVMEKTGRWKPERKTTRGRKKKARGGRSKEGKGKRKTWKCSVIILCVEKEKRFRTQEEN